jgi:hypothetical protein
VGRFELLELLQRLPAEVGAVDQKEHPPGAAELDESVDGVDSGEGLPRTGRHLNQSARPIRGQRLLQVGDCFDLRRPEPVSFQGR